jgi:hypothetical protein
MRIKQSQHDLYLLGKKNFHSCGKFAREYWWSVAVLCFLNIKQCPRHSHRQQKKLLNYTLWLLSLILSLMNFSFQSSIPESTVASLPFNSVFFPISVFYSLPDFVIESNEKKTSVYRIAKVSSGLSEIRVLIYKWKRSVEYIHYFLLRTRLVFNDRGVYCNKLTEIEEEEQKTRKVTAWSHNRDRKFSALFLTN